MRPRVHFPWLKTPPKGGFFVPTLQLEKTREAGLKAALYYKVPAKAYFGIRDGKIGVMFIRGN